MAKRTKAVILPELEALIVEFMQAENDKENLVLTGFVLKAKAIDMMSNEPQDMGTTIWLTPERQDIFMSLGLSEALAQDVSRHYEWMYDDADSIDEDPDNG
jgi:hypothetical protein